MDEDGQSYSCTKCKQVIQDVDAFVEHVIEKHGINHPLTSEKSLYAWALKCPLCIHSLYFDSIDSLLYHAECSPDGRELMLKMVLHSFHVKKKFITILRPAYEENSRTWIKLLLDELPPMSTPSTSVSNGDNYREIDSTEKKRTPESKSKVHKLTTIFSCGDSLDAVNDKEVSIVQFDQMKATQFAESDAETRRRRKMSRLQANRPPRQALSRKKLLEQTCLDCEISFENKCKFTKHLLDHKTRSFRCCFVPCQYTARSYVELNGHLRRTHANDFPSGCCSEENGTKSNSYSAAMNSGIPNEIDPKSIKTEIIDKI